MNIENFRNFCLSLPHVTEDIKWGDNLCFSVAEKVFSITSLAEMNSTFKVSPENFQHWIVKDGFFSPPYFKKGNWLCLEHITHIDDALLQNFVKESYQLVFQKLPKKLQISLSIEPI